MVSANGNRSKEEKIIWGDKFFIDFKKYVRMLITFFAGPIAV